MDDKDLRAECEVVDARDDPSWDGRNEFEALALHVDVIDNSADDPDNDRIINSVLIGFVDLSNALNEYGFCIVQKGGEPYSAGMDKH